MALPQFAQLPGRQGRGDHLSLSTILSDASTPCQWIYDCTARWHRPMAKMPHAPLTSVNVDCLNNRLRPGNLQGDPTVTSKIQEDYNRPMTNMGMCVARAIGASYQELLRVNCRSLRAVNGL